MTKNQMLAECRRLAPDFALKLSTVNGQPAIAATCTLDGQPHELSTVIGGWPRARIETRVLEGVLQKLRSRRAA